MVTLSMVDRFLHAIESGDQLPSPAAVEEAPFAAYRGAASRPSRGSDGSWRYACSARWCRLPCVRAPGRG